MIEAEFFEEYPLYKSYSFWESNHVLSEGLHALDDDECLDFASQVRAALGFVFTQISSVKQSKKTFTETMRKLLKKKATS